MLKICFTRTPVKGGGGLGAQPTPPPPHGKSSQFFSLWGGGEVLLTRRILSPCEGPLFSLWGGGGGVLGLSPLQQFLWALMYSCICVTEYRYFLPVNWIPENNNEFRIWLNVRYVMRSDKVWLYGGVILWLMAPMSVVPKCRCTALTWRIQKLC